MMLNHISQLLHRHAWLACLTIGLAVTAVVIFIWLPFGFSLIGLIEEWHLVGTFTEYDLFFIVDSSSPKAMQATRPLTIFPHALAYYLDANSFRYWHVLLMLALIVKGSAAGQLIWKVTLSSKWSIMMGVLVLLYPADTMQLSFRSLHINWSLALLLLASAIFFTAYEQNKRWVAYLLSVVSVVLFFASICMYEAALALFPMPFLLLFAKSGFRMFWRQLKAKVNLLLIWSIAPICYVIYFVWVSHQVESYQSQLANTKTLADFSRMIHYLFDIAVLRCLVGGWFDAIRIVFTEFSGYLYLTLVSLFLLAILFLNSKIQKTKSIITYLPLRLACVGLLLLMLGYAPYLLSPSHLSISQRTFLFATPGAAITWVALLMTIDVMQSMVAWLLIYLCIFFGLGAQLFQFHHYIQLGETQRKILRSIVENVKIDAGKAVVIRDESNMIGHTWMLIAESMPRILSYFYEHKIDSVQICHFPSAEWQHNDNLARQGKCIEKEKEWLFRTPESVTGPHITAQARSKDLHLDKSNVITININEDGVAANAEKSDRQKELLSANTPAAQRYRHILKQKPWPLNLVNFKASTVEDYYKWSFGKWWSLDLPERGSGWREAEWEVGKFYHRASAWKSQPNSSLYFDFLPTQDHYVLHGEFVCFVNEKIHKSTVIRINQTVIPLHWQTYTTFEATIPKGVLREGLNRIDFNSDVDMTYYGLSSELAWFEITPRSVGS